MTTDDTTLTMKNVDLLVTGWIYVKDPPGTYSIEPDGPLGLGDLLKAALDECGLGDRLEEVYRACDKAAEPRFAKRIAELEAIRLRVLADADETDQILKILDRTGTLSGATGQSTNLKPVPGTEGEQHLPYRDPGKKGREKKR